MLQPITLTSSTREHVATVTQKGQITIPARVRKHLNLKAASQLAFVVDANGTVQLKAPKYPTLESAMGAVKPLPHSFTLDVMRDALNQDRAEHYNAKVDRAATVSPDHPDQ